MFAGTNAKLTENYDGVAGGDASLNDEKGTRARRVLLVDDHDLFREILAIIFAEHTSLNENVQTGSLGEARQVLSSHNHNYFALAVVDLDLPEGGGLELIGDLRRAGIPVLALTASRDRECSARASGPGEVLTTAASGEEILLAARRLVGD